MKNIIKSQLYQIKKSSFTYIVFLAVLVMQLANLMGEWDYRGGEMYGSTYIAANGFYTTLVALIFAIVFTGQVCGADFIDRTANYELMSGHLRKQAYFSRAIISLAGGGIGAAIIIAAPVVISTAACGWGNDIRVCDAVFRYLLALLPILRIICEFIFLAYVVKNAYVIMACGFFTYILGIALPEYLGRSESVFLGITNLSRLCSFEAWTTYTVGEMKMYTVYEAGVSANDVASTLLASVIIGGLFLAIGYLYFKKDDLN